MRKKIISQKDEQLSLNLDNSHICIIPTNTIENVLINTTINIDPPNAKIIYMDNRVELYKRILSRTMK